MPKKKFTVTGYRPLRRIRYNGSTEPFTGQLVEANADVVLDMSHIDDDTLLALLRNRTLVQVKESATQPEIEETDNG